MTARIVRQQGGTCPLYRKGAVVSMTQPREIANPNVAPGRR